MFQKFNHLPPSGNSPTKFLLPPVKVNHPPTPPTPPHPPLINSFHIISQKTSFLAVVIALVLFYFIFVLFACTGHPSFDFNQC